MLGEDLEALRGLQQNQEKEALALDHEHRKLAEEFARASSRLSVARLELERLREEGDRARTQQERDQQHLDEKETARSIEEEVLEQSRTDFEELQTAAHQLMEEHAALRADLAGFEERRRSERAAQARFETQIEEIQRPAAGNHRRAGTAGRGARAPSGRQLDLDRSAAVLVEELRLAEEAVARPGRAGNHAARRISRPSRKR